MKSQFSFKINLKLLVVIMSCVWDRDAAGRNYLIPDQVHQRLCNGGRVVLPNGKTRLITKDNQVVHVQKNAKYHRDVQFLLNLIGTLTLKEFQHQIIQIRRLNNLQRFNRLITNSNGRVNDIWKLIITFLDPTAKVCLYLSCNFFRGWLNPDFKNFSLNTVRDGHLNLFLWSKFPLPRDRPELCEAAATRGHEAILFKLYDLKFPLGISYFNLMNNGHKEILKKYPAKEEINSRVVFEYYASKGDYEMFVWCYHNLNGMGPFTTDLAAKGGSIKILQILRKCQMLSFGNIYLGAIEGEHIHVLEWLKSINYPICSEACQYAIKHKKYKSLEWLRNNDFPE